MSSEKLEVGNIFPAAIRSLHERRRMTQEDMARQLGCSLRTLTQWLAGEREPSGRWLIKLLNLCPDRRSLEEFGIRIAWLSQEEEPKDLNLSNVEKSTILRVIEKHQGNISKAARELGLTRTALYRRLSKYDI